MSDAMATTCPWCKTPNDDTSVLVGEFDVLFHKACIVRAEREHQQHQSRRARQMADELDAWRQRRMAAARSVTSEAQQ